jgi:hypothetical protein
MGLQAAGENHLLMFATVPLGVIIMGTAIGVSKGLEEGLPKRIKQLIGGGATSRKSKGSESQVL